ncbi:hypothetical protein A2Z67_00940 [Candidatus Woesebacteria bacterium RBG_13_36_22]|uniref:Uncharacterized protein n=1 Tax=Candidatus Woesebacteria bacterium RBG_13_36_22 TaxID=1802478 RepID=A0A1F7WZT1_9BACT|nr:MAG: hypothetical protein A2Z67_00940 [Candidatus Woesebacteria bacterium RBG_13_36_22]
METKLEQRRRPKNPETARLNFNRLCEYCEFPIGKFRDKMSVLEFNWTGKCQECQDDLIKELEESGIPYDYSKRTIKKGLTRIGTARIK